MQQQQERFNKSNYKLYQADTNPLSMYSTTNSIEFGNKSYVLNNNNSNNENNKLTNTSRQIALKDGNVKLKKDGGGGFYVNNNPYVPTDNDLPVLPCNRWKDRLIDAHYYPTNLTMNQTSYNGNASLYKEREHANTLLSTLNPTKELNASLKKEEEEIKFHSNLTGYKSNLKTKNIVTSEQYNEHNEQPMNQNISEMKDNYHFSDPYGYNDFLNSIKN
ncbi:hypothetical protein ABK040_011468 [Willaertia magna]